MPSTAFQASLFAGGQARIAPKVHPHRRQLDDGSWVDHASGFVSGADTLFSQLTETLAWQQGRRRMYEREVDVPRLTSSVDGSDAATPPVVAEIREWLTRRYDAISSGPFAALYRDGKDSVAWHSDRVDLSRSEHTSGIVSLGGPRKFMLRPKGGGRSLPIILESGDLLVMGGTIQHRWEHCVPKVAHAHPRIALLFFGDDRDLENLPEVRN